MMKRYLTENITHTSKITLVDVLTKNKKKFCIKLCKKEMKKYWNDINVEYKSKNKSIIHLRVKYFEK